MYRFAKELNTGFLVPALAVTNARAALTAAALTLPRDNALIENRAALLAQARTVDGMEGTGEDSPDSALLRVRG